MAIDLRDRLAGLAAAPVCLGLLAAGVTAAGAAAAGNDERLVEAVRSRDRAAARALLGERVDVNAPQADGATPLHWAAHWDDVETAGLLVAAGARVGAANDYGVTPLALASTNGSLAMVELLLEAGADPGAADEHGATPLMFAARTGSADVLDALLAAGARVDVRDAAHGQTALMWAASAGHTAVLRRLIAAGADVQAASAGGYTPLLFAVRENRAAAARLLLEQRAGVNAEAADGTTALVVAVVHGRWPLAHLLLEHGADPDAAGAGFAALHWAAGVWETALTTTEAGGTAGWERYAGRGPGKLELVEALLAAGADPNIRLQKNPPTQGFLGFRRMAMAGATPFIVAARAADLDIMRALLAAGADPLLATGDETTALIAAAGYAYSIGTDIHPERDALAAARLIIDAGVDVNGANTVGETALHAAAYSGWDSVAQLLLERGAEVDAENIVGWTPLAIASGFFDTTTMTKTIHESTMALLKQHGARPTPPSHEQKRLRY